MGPTPNKDEERLALIFPVDFDLRGEKGRGIAIDLSPSGLRLRTDKEVKEGDVLDLKVTGPEGKVANVSGEARWVLELPAFLKPPYPFEVGLKIRSPTASYTDLFDAEFERFFDYRDDQRVPNLVRVELAGPGVWETTFALNLCRRGMFVHTSQPLQPGQFVEVRLEPPGDAAYLTVTMEVIHVLDREKAAYLGTIPGVGLRLVSPSKEVQRRYDAFCTYLEDQFLL